MGGSISVLYSIKPCVSYVNHVSRELRDSRTSYVNHVADLCGARSQVCSPLLGQNGRHYGGCVLGHLTPYYVLNKMPI